MKARNVLTSMLSIAPNKKRLQMQIDARDFEAIKPQGTTMAN